MLGELNFELNEEMKSNNSASDYGALMSSFVDVDKDIQSKIVSGIDDEKKRAGGLLGKLLGTNIKNAIINITSLICFSVFLIIVIDLVHSYFTEQNVNFELINLLWPVVTLSLGYMFGHSPNVK